jgi:hypothetical protein
MRFVGSAFLIIALAACGHEIGTPEDAYRLYLNALADGKLPLAWSLLDTASRERMPPIPGKPEITDGFERFKAAIDFGGSGLSPLSRETVAKASVRRSAISGDIADVEVDLPPSGTAKIRMVREGAGWKVRLNLR